MRNEFAFEQLVDLFERTHAELQRRAARSVDTALVVRNWLFGWYIVEFEQNGADRAQLYGRELINRLARRLKDARMKGCSPTNLRKFREFYEAYLDIQQTPSVTSSGTDFPFLSTKCQAVSDQSASLALPAQKRAIRPTASDESGAFSIDQIVPSLAARLDLGWSHYVTLLTIGNPDERRFYEIETAENQWSVRELERQIASSLYERLALSRDKNEIHRLSREGQVVEKAADLIKNPLVLEFLGLEEKPIYSEEQLESAIIDRLETFLLELGKGFLFEARQKRFTFDNDHFYVDLVFYNRLLRCYVLIDLKRGRLTHQDLGQMQMYVNYYDRYMIQDHEHPTVGIVLCHRKNDAVVELTLPKAANIHASQYQLYLPSKKELKAELEKIQAELGDAGAG